MRKWTGRREAREEANISHLFFFITATTQVNQMKHKTFNESADGFLWPVAPIAHLKSLYIRNDDRN